MSSPHPSANPGPFGLTGFGLTTILLNLANCGVFPSDSMICAMGICLGCILQLIGGIGAYVAGKTAPALTFCAYGLFWMCLSLITIFNSQKTVTAAGDTSLAWWLFIFGVFSICMMIANWRSNWVLRFTFITVVILFFLLAIKHWMAAHGGYSSDSLNGVSKLAGADGVLCGSLAFYLAMAEVLDGEYGYEVFPYFKIVKPASSGVQMTHIVLSHLDDHLDHHEALSLTNTSISHQ